MFKEAVVPDGSRIPDTVEFYFRSCVSKPWSSKALRHMFIFQHTCRPLDFTIKFIWKNLQKTQDYLLAKVELIFSVRRILNSPLASTDFSGTTQIFKVERVLPCFAGSRSKWLPSPHSSAFLKHTSAISLGWWSTPKVYIEYCVLQWDYQNSS